MCQRAPRKRTRRVKHQRDCSVGTETWRLWGSERCSREPAFLLIANTPFWILCTQTASVWNKNLVYPHGLGRERFHFWRKPFLKPSCNITVLLCYMMVMITVWSDLHREPFPPLCPSPLVSSNRTHFIVYNHKSLGSQALQTEATYSS